MLGCLGERSGKKDAAKPPPSPLFYRIDEEGPFLEFFISMELVSACQEEAGALGGEAQGPVRMASGSLTAVP